MDKHPDWCTRTACTAFGVEGDDGHRYERWHRSAPIVIDTNDPSIGICVHRFAEADGTDEHIELAAVELPVARPWYLAEPVRGRTILLRRETATALMLAVSELA
ncbi:hypothetical protein ACFO1B_51465 [Dactylosporangium siamense]|uniref:Uncharacterized protein n=1 Tax=Dactylosporangium siamense TaxID=685454 RepID=A0A919PJQ2_9ACTN|nr:hypothetical protein [Dactylosporangium siamense]GIG43760.1 hypothetical protein Dsi01nite_018010 [Dactylosporangium siamense]